MTIMASSSTASSVALFPRHRLASLFDPQSILVVSDLELPISKAVPEQLAQRIGFIPVQADQPIHLTHIQPHPSLEEGAELIPELAPEAPAQIDLVVICVPPPRLPDVLDALTARLPQCVLVLRHSEEPAQPGQDAVLCREWGEEHDVMVLGPGSFGLQRPHRELNLSLDAYRAPSGRVAVVTQSTSIMAALLDWAEDISLGFSALLSVGVDSPLDVSEVLDFLSMDNRTTSIVLYLEHPLSSRRFTSALHAAASVKPVVLLKPGRYPINRDPTVQQQAAAESAVFNALLRRTGAVRVRYFIQLFSALKVLVHSRRPRGRRIAILSNGRAGARLALDVMGPDAAVFPAELSQTTARDVAACLEKDADSTMPNPVVVRRTLHPDLTEKLVKLLAEDSNVDGVLVVVAPDQYADIQAVADRLAAITGKQRKPIITCLMGDAGMRELRHRFDQAGAPAFRTPESAVEGFGLLASYHYSQTLAQQALPPEPLAWPPRTKEARRIIRTAQQDGRRQLTEDESRRLMECFYIPVELEPSLLVSPGTVTDVPPMAIRMRHDKRFGPYIAFGAGRDVEWVAHSSRAVELPPLNRYLARQLVQRSVLWRRVLSRQVGADDLELLFEALERVSDMVCELAVIEDISIDPLYPGDRLMRAGRIQIDVAAEPAQELPEAVSYKHLAIHPYPRQLVREMTFKNGDPWLLRPIRREDAQPLQDFIRNLSEESRYMRFVSMLHELTPRMLARYTLIDYDRELALVATVTEPNPEHRGYPREIIIGFAHYLRNADGQGAEYALAVADDWQRCGLGARLMRSLIEAARDQGLTYIDGYVLANNRPMLGLMTSLGFQNDRDPDDPGMRRVWLGLG